MSMPKPPTAHRFDLAGGRRYLPIVGLLVALFALAASPLTSAAEAKKKRKNQRIAALTPFTVQTLAKLRVKPVVIGETVTDDVRIPRRFRGIPRVPLSHAANGPNPEQLVQRRVDVVFSERTWRAGHGALENFGMKVREFDPTSLSQYGRKIKQIGRFVGERRRAKRLARSMRKRVRRATRRISDRPNTLVLLGVGESAYAFLENSWGGDLFDRAGANLLTDRLTSDSGGNLLVSGGFAQLSDEEIIIRNPDVIVAVPHGRSEDLDEIEASLHEDEILNGTNAGQNDRIYVTANNSLLQPDLRVPRVIKMIRGRYLDNR